MAVFVSASEESDGGHHRAGSGMVDGWRQERIGLPILHQHGKSACLMRSLAFRFFTRQICAIQVR